MRVACMIRGRVLLNFECSQTPEVFLKTSSHLEIILKWRASLLSPGRLF